MGLARPRRACRAAWAAREEHRAARAYAVSVPNKRTSAALTLRRKALRRNKTETRAGAFATYRLLGWAVSGERTEPSGLRAFGADVLKDVLARVLAVCPSTIDASEIRPRRGTRYGRTVSTRALPRCGGTHRTDRLRTAPQTRRRAHAQIHMTRAHTAHTQTHAHTYIHTCTHAAHARIRTQTNCDKPFFTPRPRPGRAPPCGNGGPSRAGPRAIPQ